VICFDVFVNPGPVTRPDYVPTSPQPPPPVRVGLSLPVSLSIQVLNQGNATATSDATVAFYERPSPPFSTFTLTPLAPAATSSRFTATWTSPAVPGTYRVSVDVDYHGNITEWNESNNNHTWTIDVVRGPITSLSSSGPIYASTATYVSPLTYLGFSVIDQSGTGINKTMYKVDNATWIDYATSGRFLLTSEGERYLEWYSVDNAGNVEEVDSKVLRVDGTAPTTTAIIGDPKYLVGGQFVNSSTPFSLSPSDGGPTPAGVDFTTFRIDGGSWNRYSSPFHMTTEGWHRIEFYSVDYLMNTETARNITVFVDDTPPATSILPANGPYTTATVFTLPATDSGSGVRVTRYRMDGGGWNDFTTGFTLSEGGHTISFYSIDNLDNTETERSVDVNVTSTTPPSVEANYKPVVAVIFAVALLLAGVWSSRRKPWRGEKERMAVAKAFVITSLPFVVAEAVTGLVSFSTGQLPIPPVIGTGTAIDIGILLAGLVVSFYRILRRA